MSIIERSRVSKRMSQVTRHGNILYLAGQVASDVEQDMTGQTRQVLESVDELLKEHNSDRSRILFCQIFLSDMSQFQAMNAVWDDWVSAGQAPPRATVGATLASPKKLIEIVVTAATSA
ncbi:L-PSP family endoribonuclease [Caballeronia pedi]|uniref:L-PSP family endoribonuclease n=1 Tax=Caballeronia pedi TaxID=1777141 RepID=A0A158CRE7_9BURK|nr:L-PSP family endoribonuclease [Caballeronia pedi]